jgi:hypothetical protein
MATSKVVNPADPARARAGVELRQGSRSGPHGRSRGRRRQNIRAKALRFERQAG